MFDGSTRASESTNPKPPLVSRQRHAYIGGWELELRAGAVSLDQANPNPLRWTEETYRIFGYEPGARAVTQALFMAAVHPDDWSGFVAVVNEVLTGKKPCKVEHRTCGPDGIERQIEHCIQLVTDHAGQPLRLLATCQDITEPRRAEAALREYEDQLRLIMDAVPACISYIDRDCRYRLANRAYERWFGQDPEALCGRSVREFLGDEAWQIVGPLLHGALHGERQQIEYEVPYRDGKRWVNLSYTPDPDPSGWVRGVVVLATDVGAYKAAEQGLRQAAAQSESTSRAKDEFLAMLGHELRNPLAPIVTAVQLMKLRGDVATPNERMIIERQSQHLLRLVDDLLDVARIARGKVEFHQQPVELALVIAKAVEMASPLLELHQHTLHLTVAPGLVVSADETRLAQVFTNLLTNAAKYTNRGGRITLTARREGADIVTRVVDNGIGIARELLSQVFDLFVQGPRGVDRQQGGLGLGLALVRNIVTRHGGQVAAYSDGAGRGSEFVVRLPGLAAEVAVPAAALPPYGPQASCGARVMVVDDNVDAAELLAELLTRSGYQVAVAHDALQALDLAPRFAPEVAVLDIGLPVMDGYELAERLRKQSSGRVPTLIALTGYGQTSDRERAQSAGFARHLIKPVDDEVLLHAIAEFTQAAREFRTEP